MNSFGDAVRAARKAAKLTQKGLAERLKISQPYVYQIESGLRGGDVSSDLVSKLERTLNLSPGSLARHLADDHPARLAVGVKIPIAGVVAAGAARDEPAEDDASLCVSDSFAGCVGYMVRGDSMAAELIGSGDFLIVRPATEREPKSGDVVVAWIAGKSADEGGHVVKNLTRNKRDRSLYLTSGGDRWTHKLTDADQVFGVLVGVVRMC